MGEGRLSLQNYCKSHWNWQKLQLLGLTPSFGYNKQTLVHETFIGIGSKLWGEPVNPFSWKLQAFLYCLYPRPLLLLRHSPKKYSTKKILPILCKFYEVPNWVDVPNLIILSFFLSLEIPKKKSIEILYKNSLNIF